MYGWTYGYWLGEKGDCSAMVRVEVDRLDEREVSSTVVSRDFDGHYYIPVATSEHVVQSL